MSSTASSTPSPLEGAPGRGAPVRLAGLGVALTDRGVLPDALVRAGIRALLRRRLAEIDAGDAQAAAARIERFVEHMARSPVALLPEKANEQHYEVAAEFYGLVLGRHRKYSSGYFRDGVRSLDEAEAEALRLTCEHARIADGMRILELGCGWGSLTLWMAEHYPQARITAVSNSQSQRAYIVAEAARRRLHNVEVLTRDMNAFEAPGRYERIVSVEMFEHMRNWAELFARVHRWLEPSGRLLLHVFVHRSVPYAFEPVDDSDWMSRWFFSGGMMPSDELALRTCGPLALEQRWRWDGRHYARTAECWLERLDAQRPAALAVLRAAYGANAPLWLQRWRVFFMACAELFGHRHGQEWWVSQYLFAPREK